MFKKLNYCRGIVIVHGKSELLLAEYIKSNLHLPIYIYSENNGTSSIQINGLMKILRNSIFKNSNCLSKNLIVEYDKKKIINFFVMPIMDLDDASEDMINKYKSGELFKSHWLSDYIIPI